MLTEEEDVKIHVLAKRTWSISEIAGYRAYFTTAADLAARCQRAALEGRWAPTMRFFSGPAVLIVDELGLLSMPAEDAAALFQVISRRYLKGSIILTTNRGVASWGDIFTDATIAAAMLDRLLHRSVVINIDGTATGSAPTKPKPANNDPKEETTSLQPNPGWGNSMSASGWRARRLVTWARRRRRSRNAPHQTAAHRYGTRSAPHPAQGRLRAAGREIANQHPGPVMPTVGFEPPQTQRTIAQCQKVECHHSIRPHGHADWADDPAAVALTRTEQADPICHDALHRVRHFAHERYQVD